MKGPIFILGCGRTGSKIYSNVLNLNPNIYIAPEINYLSLWKKGVVSHLKKIGSLKNDKNARDAVELMFSGKLKKPFWKNLDLDKKEITNQILLSDRKYKNILYIILKEKAKKQGKIIFGAKFPTHFSYLPKLYSWFPNAKILFLIRDPRGILASELKMKSKRSYTSEFPIKKSNILFSVSVMMYVSIQWLWAKKISDRYKDNRNFYLSKFEDLVSEPEDNIKKICEFLNVEYHPEMLNVRVWDSSFSGTGKPGFAKETIYRWRKTLNPLMKYWYSITMRKSLKELGYDIK